MISNSQPLNTDQLPRPIKRHSCDRYIITTNIYTPDAGTEALLLLGLSHTDQDSAQKRSYWMYLNNPAGEAYINTLRHSKSHQDIGMVAICHRKIWTPSGTANAGILCDLVIDEKYRTLGPALKLMQHAIDAAQEAALDRVYGWPSSNSISIFKRLSNSDTVSVAILRRYLDWNHILDKKMPSLLAKAIAPIFSLPDKAMEGLSALCIKQFFEIEHPTRFDLDFDDLWNNAKRRYQEIGIRDSSFLNWRFRTHELCEYKIFALYSKRRRRPLGYIVYRPMEDHSLDISDFLAVSNGITEYFLLSSFSAFARKNGAKSISMHFHGNRWTMLTLRLCGFFTVGKQIESRRQSENSILRSSKPITHITKADQDFG